MPSRGQTTDPFDRFWEKVEITDPNGCWIWTASRGHRGHGRFVPDGRRSGPRRSVYAHVYAYRMLVGDVPIGRELDHLCRVPPCVNPNHLEPVTHRENVLRGTGPTAENARLDHCRRGHPLNGDNLYIEKGTGGRRCRQLPPRRLREEEGMRAKYFAGAAGRRYFYDSDPILRCPLYEEAKASQAQAGYHPGPLLGALAEAVTETPLGEINIVRLMLSAHRNTQTRADDDGYCTACGAQLETVGYRSWRDEPDPIGLRLGLMSWTRRDEKTWPTKREAIQWAREEAAIDRAAAREETRT